MPASISRRKQSRGARRTSRERTQLRFHRRRHHNALYNPKGKYQSLEFVFPYPDASFDVVFLTSVFTHMFPPDVKHYLDEISRVLKPGGRCLSSYFLMNEESLALSAAGKGNRQFKHEMPGIEPNQQGLRIGDRHPRNLHQGCPSGIRPQGAGASALRQLEWPDGLFQLPGRHDRGQTSELGGLRRRNWSNACKIRRR